MALLIKIGRGQLQRRMPPSPPLHAPAAQSGRKGRDMTDTTNSPLTELTAKVKAEHLAATAAARKALDHALDCGDALIEAKKWVPHGSWQAWLETVGLSKRTAQLYMRLARNRDALESATVAHLSIRAAADMLAKKSAARPTRMTRSEMLEEVEHQRQRADLLAAYAELSPADQDAFLAYIRAHGTGCALDGVKWPSLDDLTRSEWCERRLV